LCDEQIALNRQKRELIEGRYESHVKDRLNDTDKTGLMRSLSDLAVERKESLKKLLQASLLVNKVLISGEPNRYGDFVRLGISASERKKLLKRINEIDESADKGIREGQTFLQASFSAIRERLEDKAYSPLDG